MLSRLNVRVVHYQKLLVRGENFHTNNPGTGRKVIERERKNLAKWISWREFVKTAIEHGVTVDEELNT
jgi:hypothetical protein